MNELETRLREELTDREYRHSYAHEFLDSTLAHQIRALRKQRKWTQADLADRLGTKQSFISAIESEDYGSLSLSTLKELAEVFDVYLGVRFGSFSRLLADIRRSSAAALEVPEFADDPFFAPTSVVTTSATFQSENPRKTAEEVGSILRNADLLRKMLLSTERLPDDGEPRADNPFVLSQVA